MFPEDSITFSEQTVNGKLYFLCSMKLTVEYSGQVFEKNSEVSWCSTF